MRIGVLGVVYLEVLGDHLHLVRLGERGVAEDVRRGGDALELRIVAQYS